MDKNIKKKSKNLKRPKVRFNFGVLLVIFVLSFTACFGLYMTAVNLNEDFFRNEFNAEMIIDNSEADETEDTEQEDEEPEQEEQPIQKAPVTNPVPQSAAADYTYFENCCLITDSTFKKPENVYFMLGSDIGTSETETMLESYKELISNLTASLPAMNIYIMQIPPVRYDSAPVTNELINTYNEQLLAMANSCNVYCIDTSTALKSVDGNLKEEYWSAEDKKFTEDMYKAVTEYIITHVA